MTARYYLSPFLKSHSLHLIVGPRNSGKTTYALQMLAYPYFGGTEADPWVQFERSMPETIWYVDLIRPRENVMSQVAQLGLAQPDPGSRTLHVLTYDQITDARPEPNRKDPIRFADILQHIAATSQGELPLILIIDGFSVLLMPPKDVSQSSWEKERLAEIDQTYLRQGGCLVGIQTHTKAGRIPGVELPGTHILSHFISSVTEITKTKRERRKVMIEGEKLSRSMYLEFDYAGRLRPASDLDVNGKVRSKTTDAELLQIAIDLSLGHPRAEFERSDLIELAESRVNASSSTVDRWMKRGRTNGTIRSAEKRGVFTLWPKPELPLLQ